MGSKSSGKTLADFRAKFDASVVVPNKIREALVALAKEHGPEAWEAEGEFMKRAQLSHTDIGKYRDQFEKHLVMVRERGRDGRRIWFADARVAAKVRG